MLFKAMASDGRSMEHLGDSSNLKWRQDTIKSGDTENLSLNVLIHIISVECKIS